MRPLIGITLDSEEPGGYAQFPWYAVRANYCAAVTEAGGLPVTLPHEPGLADAYLDRLDGLLVTGGHFDVDPATYGNAEAHETVGNAEAHETVKLKTRRTEFEWALAEAALARDMPVLGICGGQQLLHVVLGGALIQHIPDEVENALAHEQPNPRNEPGHMVAIATGHPASRYCADRRAGREQRPSPGGEGRARGCCHKCPCAGWRHRRD